MNSGGSGAVYGPGARRMVVAALIVGAALFIGVTRLGFVTLPVPLIGNVTVMHVPAVVGGVLAGPVVGLLAGAVFGVFSFLYADDLVFQNPLVAVVPRLFIGVVAWAVFVRLRRFSVDFASVVAGLLGSLANTAMVLTLSVLLGLLPPLITLVFLPQAIAEAVLAAVVTVVVVRIVMLFRSGRATAPEPGEERLRQAEEDGR